MGRSPAPDALAIVREITASELAPFEDQAAFDAYVGRLGDALRAQARADREWESDHETMLVAPAAEESAEPAPSPGGDESITNTQEAGVDEGGIVKAHGEHLVVLRRGRLFSARLGEDGQLAPLSMVSVVPFGASGGWYDEMLIHGDTIIVVGFNYEESGTEIGLFDIDAGGAITRRSTHYLRSDDYYSSRNYASRLVGDTLLFYMPLALAHLDGGDQVRLGLPATRDRGRAEWRTIIEATQIHRPVQATLHPTLHTVVACDLRQPGLRCVAQGVLGPAGRTFYVSPRAVYVWVGPDPWEASLAAGPARSVVYRLPLGEGRIGAMRVAGMPIDQLSFAERGDRLHVLVGAEGGGDAMWTAEGDRGALALMSVPLGGLRGRARQRAALRVHAGPRRDGLRHAEPLRGRACSTAATRTRSGCSTCTPTRAGARRRASGSRTARSASRPSARAPWRSARATRGSPSARSISRARRASPAPTRRPPRRRARAGPTASSIAPPRRPRARSACPFATRGRAASPSTSTAPRASCSSACRKATACASTRSGRSTRAGAPPRTGAWRAASTGTGTRGPSSTEAASSRCSATSSSRVASPRAASPRSRARTSTTTSRPPRRERRDVTRGPPGRAELNGVSPRRREVARLVSGLVRSGTGRASRQDEEVDPWRQSWSPCERRSPASSRFSPPSWRVSSSC
ncbi:MAG: beta-propeller domain-containing protein [Sandaracinaceae bacterium]|nr:beta-propeller domain-containing protein [Sandaracinaceae bacterium]